MRPSLAFVLLGAAACAPRAAVPPAPRLVEVEAGDYFFRAPDSIPAGLTTFRLANAGGHHVMLILRIDSGRTLADVAAVPDTAPVPGWLVSLGGVVTLDTAFAPGMSATLDLAPGAYALLCYFGDERGRPHYALGMVRALTVTGAPDGPAATAPAADVVVTMSDYDFRLSRPLTPGPHVLRFVNTSGQGHEAIIVRLDEGADLATWQAARRAGRPMPGRRFGGAADVEPGADLLIAADFPAGRYVWFCYASDRGDGRSHLDHGMAREIRVAE